MILNNFVVSYWVMTTISLGLCIPAAWVGWFVAGRWKSGIECEQQSQLEKSVYLVITLICLAFSMRLFMIPLWFLTLQSLIPSVPGAMCMAGIHSLDVPISYLATILKFFIPLAYLYWLILNSADRRIESQPFLTQKLRLVLPLAVLMAAESFLDAHFLHWVRPKIVSCCTFMFDVPRAAAMKVIRRSSVLWMFSFYIFLGMALFLSWLRSERGRMIRILSALSSALALIFLVLTLHTKVSPLMLEAPFHQCIFCLWQGIPDIAIASALLIMGLWLNFVFAAIPDLRQHSRAILSAGKLKLLATLLCSVGAVWLTIRFVLKYLSGV